MTGRVDSAARREVLRNCALRVPQGVGGRPVRVGIDGLDGAGKTVFADELAETLGDLGRQAVRVSLDGFHHPREVRYRRGRASPEGFFGDSYDYAAFRREVLDPFTSGPPARYRSAVRDVATDLALAPDPEPVPADAVLVVDGIFLHRDELAGAWDLSVFLRVDLRVTYARMAIRDGADPDPHHPGNDRYVAGQGLYVQTCDPERRAHVVVDNSDLAHPRLVMP